MRLPIATVAVCLTTACLVTDADDEAGSSTTAPADSSGGPTSSSSQGSADSSSTGDGSGGSGGTGDSGTADETGDTGELGPCVDAINFEGNPFYTGDFENALPDGQPLLADPPLASYHLAPIDGGLAVETQLEVWVADAASETMRRIAGNGAQDDEYVPAPACADLRPLFISGITTRPNGNIVIADNVGNAVIELDDPLGSCTAQVIAGNSQSILSYMIDEGAAFPGDVDGPGAMAQFYGPSLPFAVGDDVYVFDVGNHKLKRIAGDADRTVSTLHDHNDRPDLGLKAMTAIGETLFVTGVDGIQDVVWSFDLATDAQTVVFDGLGLFPETGDNAIANLYGMTNDGQNLVVASAQGYLLGLSPTGEALGVIAGYGTLTHYEPDLDVTQPIPVAELPIRSNNTVTSSLVRSGSNLYFTGNGGGVGFHIWEIHCG